MSLVPAHSDVVVVGAGPAGSVAARRLALEGREVVLLERARLPRRKVCGACLGPTALDALHREGLGSMLARLGGRRLDRLQLRTGDARAEVRLHGNLALSRERFDAALVEEARRSGVRVIDGCRVRIERVEEDLVRLAMPGGTMTARVVIDASGLSGGVGTEGPDGGDTRVASDSYIGVGAVFEADAFSLDEGVLRMITGRTGYVGLVRIEDGRVNVAAALAPETLAAEAGTGGGVAEAVADLLGSVGEEPPRSDPTESWKGTPRLTRRPVSLARKRVFRIGDAAGYVEPFTGEGMGWAIRSAGLVAPHALRALEERDENVGRAWERTYRRTIARSQSGCRVLSRALRHPRLVRGVVRLLEHAPRLADPVVRATGPRRWPGHSLADGVAGPGVRS